MPAENCYVTNNEKAFCSHILSSLWSHFFASSQPNKEFPVSSFTLLYSDPSYLQMYHLLSGGKTKQPKQMCFLTRWHIVSILIHSPGRVWGKSKWKLQKRGGKTHVYCSPTMCKVLSVSHAKATRVTVSLFLPRKEE